MITADKTYSKETIQLYQTQDTPAKAAQNSQQQEPSLQSLSRNLRSREEHQRLAEDPQPTPSQAKVLKCTHTAVRAGIRLRRVPCIR